MKNIIVIALILFCLCSCKKSTIGNEANGVVKDFTGLDGCGLLIVLDNGKRLEIQSLPVGITLAKDKRVAITYKPAQGFSICMAGEIVSITSLRYL